jgi:hypothetical protein
VLNIKQSYVYAQQQKLLNRIGNFFSGNPTASSRPTSWRSSGSRRPSGAAPSRRR